MLPAPERREALMLLDFGTIDEWARVDDRLAALVAPPDGVTRRLVLGVNRLALDK